MLKRLFLSLVLNGVFLGLLSPGGVSAQVFDGFPNQDRSNNLRSRGEISREKGVRQPRDRRTSPTQEARPREQPAFDIRGQWVGKAKGKIFGADGSVMITHQQGEDFQGMVEGSNIFGKAKFDIKGKIQGGYIFGSKEGHTFRGQLYADGSIRGLFRASDGDEYRIVLQRSVPQWDMQSQGPSYQEGAYGGYGYDPYQGYPSQGTPYQSMPYQGYPYQGGQYQYPGNPYQQNW